MNRTGLVRVSNGATEAWVVPAAVAAWSMRGWGVVDDTPAPAPKKKPRPAKRSRAAKPRTHKTPPAPAAPPARDDSAERLDSDEPETAPAEESA